MIVIVVIWTTFVGYGYWIALIKKRSTTEGAALGLLLGPIGCLIEATRRERTVEEVDEERIGRLEAARIKQEEENQLQVVLQADAIRRREEAQVRAQEAKAKRAENFDRFAMWFDRAVLKFGWYKALPEVAQPIVIGLLIALPLAFVATLFFKGR